MLTLVVTEETKPYLFIEPFNLNFMLLVIEKDSHHD